ncbi:integral membrane protein GPR137C [Takifugu rubripes]|uniref:Integral membrane protein GPR137B n=2 Tax=Takifugu TaxID=31032 RepID=A0A5C6NA37_9TELE|nr:integral membrane protein GPR137B [Takifugu rubripes]XP_056883863.1 integral membrane protein GPR137C [Takifugu flavidus]TWW64066.1 Integral membrane protein GPR137B [Takifugu flavidus]|eukprot:XP_011604446.1 PREDICTED: integral membrane protein GPR137C isoform X1 [Takifugu rubripes]
MFSEGEAASTLFTSLKESHGAAISPTLELSVTTVYTVLYSFLFVFVYLQLWLILHYGHKRFSYQSVFLFLCLLWAALRTTLFSFYFKNVVQANQLQPLAYWLLYCCPVCLQFFTLCLLNLYFTQVMFKAKAKYSPELTKYKLPLRLFFLSLSIFFLVVNLTCALLVQGALIHSESPSDGGIRHAVLARVVINDSLFVLCAVSLAVCIFKIAKMSSANVYLESKGTSVCQATAIGAVVILLYTSRACYNLVVVSLSPQDRPSPFNYGWYSVSDQAEVQEVSGQTYIVFGVILFFWELLPTSLVVVFFRVQRPNQNLAPGGMINSHSFSSRAYFFDNPRRYDSDDDLSRNGNRTDRTSTPQVGTSSWYGSIQCNGALTAGIAAAAQHTSSSTAPLLFTYANVHNPHHHHHNYYSTPQNNNHHHHSNFYSTPQNYYCGSQTYFCTPQN